MTKQSVVSLNNIKTAFREFRRTNTVRRPQYPKQLRRLVVAPELIGVPGRLICAAGEISTGSLFNWRREFLGQSVEMSPRQLHVISDPKDSIGKADRVVNGSHDSARFIFRSGVTMEIPIHEISRELIQKLNAESVDL